MNLELLIALDRVANHVLACGLDLPLLHFEVGRLLIPCNKPLHWALILSSRAVWATHRPRRGKSGLKRCLTNCLAWLLRSYRTTAGGNFGASTGGVLLPGAAGADLKGPGGVSGSPFRKRRKLLSVVKITVVSFRNDVRYVSNARVNP